MIQNKEIDLQPEHTVPSDELDDSFVESEIVLQITGSERAILRKAATITNGIALALKSNNFADPEDLAAADKLSAYCVIFKESLRVPPAIGFEIVQNELEGMHRGHCEAAAQLVLERRRRDLVNKRLLTAVDPREYSPLPERAQSEAKAICEEFNYAEISVPEVQVSEGCIQVAQDYAEATLSQVLMRLYDRSAEVDRFINDTLDSIIDYSDMAGLLLRSSQYARWVRSLKSAAELFVNFENQGDLMASEIYKPLSEEIAGAIEAQVDSIIAARNADLYRNSRLTRKQRRARAAARIAAERVFLPEATEEVSSTMTLPAVESGADVMPQILEPVADVDLMALPWLHGGAIRNVETVESGSDRVYIFSAMTPKLAKISKEVRENVQARKKLDNDKELVAGVLLQGEDPGGIQSVRSLSNVEDHYKNTCKIVYYTTEQSPNALRKYFAVMKLHEVDPRVDEKHPEGFRDCIVVLAETDKKNQLSVLKDLTTESHASLRASGAGSI